MVPTLVAFVKNIKTGSALWIKANSAFKNFSHWQDGYPAFTCSIGDLDGLIEYIKGQEEHHRRTTFAEEYKEAACRSRDRI